MPDDNTIVHQWFDEVWNKGDENAIERFMGPDSLFHGLPGEPDVRGPGEFKPFWRKFKGAFPDIRIQVVETIVEGNKVAARCVVTGVHQGDHLGVKATQRRIEVGGMVLAYVKDGQIKEGWNYFDLLGMNMQLGLQ
jgi:steroid delta-isomerase-like uncharacterized protein